MLSKLSSLSIASLRKLDEEANKGPRMVYMENCLQKRLD